MDWYKLRDRYLQDDWPIRLGNLASTLARVSNTVANPDTLSTVSPAVREAMLMIEWNLYLTPKEVLIQLAPLQSELGLWSRGWDAVAQSGALQQLLARRAREMSDLVL